ncbi:MAG: sulfotransferase [Candidatus Binatia bacterium]
MQDPPPNRPFAIKAINKIGGVAQTLGLVVPGLDPENLLATAAKRTGLSDFGDRSFREGLEQLVAALEGEARLSQIGRIGTRARLLDNLCTRLQLIEYRQQHPKVAQQQIVRPLFVLGLPRTGTTIFYELLAQDPVHRAPMSWEVDEPMPPAQRETYASDPRIEQVDRKLAQVEVLAPGFKSIHEIGATLPQECSAMWATQFWGEVFGTPYYIPSFRRWTLEYGAVQAYRWHHQFLQHMQSEYARERWVLKTPPHLAYLNELVAQYPDAVIVWTHRDPLSVIGSVSSLACTLRSAMSDHIDPMATGPLEAEFFAALLKRGLEQREAMPDRSTRFFDVAFRDIITDPVPVIEQMYAHFGFEFSDGLRQRMQGYLASRPREKHGTHRYALEDYGLSAEKHGLLFSEYCERYARFIAAQ